MNVDLLNCQYSPAQLEFPWTPWKYNLGLRWSSVPEKEKKEKNKAVEQEVNRESFHLDDKVRMIKHNKKIENILSLKNRVNFHSLGIDVSDHFFWSEY